MNGWTVELTTSAEREFRQLEDGPQQAAAELIADLAKDPSLVPALEMRANSQIWRVRFHQDRYRMIYQIAKNRAIVRRIRARPTAYKGMKN